MKKWWIILFILCPVFSFFGPHPLKEKQLKQDVLAYLEKSRGWSGDDLLKTRVVVDDWKSNGTPWRYRVEVWTKNEPGTRYEFYSEGNGQVKLFSLPSRNGVDLLERAEDFTYE